MGQARTKFVRAQHTRALDRDIAAHVASAEYGMSCLYCDEYDPNVRKPKNKFGGYVCRDCR